MAVEKVLAPNTGVVAEFGVAEENAGVVWFVDAPNENDGAEPNVGGTAAKLPVELLFDVVTLPKLNVDFGTTTPDDGAVSVATFAGLLF